MSVTRLSLYETLGNVCHMSVFIRDISECLSHVCLYTGHLGMSVTRLSLNETLGNVCYMSVFIRDTWECLSHVCLYTGHLGMSVTRLSLNETLGECLSHVCLQGWIQVLEKGGSKVMYEAQRVSWGWGSQPFDVFLDKTVEIV